MPCHTSPALLKEHVGIVMIYIRPLQKDLDLIPLKDEGNDINVGYLYA